MAQGAAVSCLVCCPPGDSALRAVSRGLRRAAAGGEPGDEEQGGAVQ